MDNNVPWLHMDLSSSNRKGGLVAVSSAVNGFGVSFGVNMIEKLMKKYAFQIVLIKPYVLMDETFMVKLFFFSSCCWNE